MVATAAAPRVGELNLKTWGQAFDTRRGAATSPYCSASRSSA